MGSCVFKSLCITLANTYSIDLHRLTLHTLSIHPRDPKGWRIPGMSCSAPRWQRPKPPWLLAPWEGEKTWVMRLSTPWASQTLQFTEQRERGIFQMTVRQIWIMPHLWTFQTWNTMETLHQTGWRSKTTKGNGGNQRGSEKLGDELPELRHNIFITFVYLLMPVLLCKGFGSASQKTVDKELKL